MSIQHVAQGCRRPAPSAPSGPSGAPFVSIIIPSLNEERYLGRTLDSVAVQEGEFEVIVVDGGSTDGTIDVAKEHHCPRLRVLQASRGRALQMNAGAAEARGEVFLFLHADTQLTKGGLDAACDALRAPAAAAGAFRLIFDESSPLLDFYAICSRIPWRYTCFGDRGIFMRRSAFASIGGFPDIPIFEDLEIVRRLKQVGRFRYLSQPVVTAARRFERYGRLRQQLKNARLWAHYLAQTDPHKVARMYRYE